MKTFCLSFNEATWRNVPACVQISASQCNVSLAGAADEHGCVMLRVRAHRRGLMSEPVKACSRFGEELLPLFDLKSSPELGSGASESR